MLFDQQGNLTAQNLFPYPTENFEDLFKKAIQCNRCHLRKSCKGVVMGEGNLTKKIMFIGEGPGANEDKLSRPFVGRAGKLLDKIFQAVGINRESVYLTNIIKCRPPGNRVPNRSEYESCAPILMAEIKIIEPKVIIPLGSTALKYLLDQDGSITRQRGKWVKRGKYYFLPTFHPAYLLRNKSMKKFSWKDFKMIKKSIERINKLKDEGRL